MNKDWVTASQLGEWEFCAHSWYLKNVKGLQQSAKAAKRMGAGARSHTQHITRAARSATLYRTSTFIAIGVVAILFYLLFVGALPLDADPFSSRFLWMAMAAALLASAIARMLAAAGTRSAGLPNGTTALYGDGGPLPCMALRLPNDRVFAQPDLVLKTKGFFNRLLIVAENKTTDSPHPRPFPNQEIQLLVAVALLRHLKGSRAAPFGYLIFTDPTTGASIATNRIDLDKKAARWINQRTAELRDAQAIGYADRNHNSPAKCRGCGFRADCEVALADS